MTEEQFKGLLSIGHEIAAIEGAGDTGMGAGQYEVFVTRGSTEYRVAIEPYWDEDGDETIERSTVVLDVDPDDMRIIREWLEGGERGPAPGGRVKGLWQAVNRYLLASADTLPAGRRCEADSVREQG